MEIHAAAAEIHGLWKCGKSQECLRIVTQELRLLPCQGWWEQQPQVHLHHCTRHGQWAGGAGSCGAAGKFLGRARQRRRGSKVALYEGIGSFGTCSVRLMVGFDKFRGLFQPNRFVCSTNLDGFYKRVKKSFKLDLLSFLQSDTWTDCNLYSICAQSLILQNCNKHRKDPLDEGRK